MNSQSQSTPDLASILQTLSSFTSANVSQKHAQASPVTPSAASALPFSAESELWAHTRNETRLAAAQVLQNNTYGQTSYGSAQQPSLKPSWSVAPSGESSNDPQSVVDPASIIDWSTALRCIMKTIAWNDTILPRIRKVRFFICYVHLRASAMPGHAPW